MKLKQMKIVANRNEIKSGNASFITTTVDESVNMPDARLIFKIIDRILKELQEGG